LIYNYAEGESKYQHALRQNYYQKNYILNTEIKKYENGKYSGVWGDLVGKYIPSLTFHHRHPLYLNFDYRFNILKYNIKEDTSKVHEELFNILNNCFYGNDLNLEKFNIDYFHTNIVKRIDSKVSDMCGFTSSLTTSIMLNEKTCCSENWKSEYKDIYIPLCVPFEKYFKTNGFLDVSRLPSIDTKGFIDYKFDTIKPPTNGYEYEGNIVNKYDNLRYSIVSGDLRTDWSYIEADQENRIASSGVDDLSTKLFIAPIKIDMSYKYYCSSSFIDGSDNSIQLGFMLAPSNTSDELYNNIKVVIYNDDYQPDLDNESNIVEVIDDFDTYFSVGGDRSKLLFNTAFKNKLRVGYVVEVQFSRTCGYYYLFNGYKKEILVHLFVNGEYDGFSIASNGIRTNEYYDHYLDELNQTWVESESALTDESMYSNVTYTTPRSYLYTKDRKYLVSIEPTGNEMEQGYYLTTEGYLVDDESENVYTGPIIREYNDNMYKYTPLNLDLFKQNVYLSVRYPSENFKVHKNLIPRLNTVEFKNAVEVY
jgi:hypothetical protein